MYFALASHAVSIAGRIGIILAIWSAIPQNGGEAFAEGEAIVVMHAECSHAVEPDRQRAVHCHLHLQQHRPGHRIGQSSLIGHAGRRISATLLAPLRC